MGPHLFRKGDIWHFRFQHRGRRVQRSTKQTSRRVAERMAADALEEVKRGADGLEKLPTVKELAGAWIEAHRFTFSRTHVNGMRIFMREHLHELAGVKIDRVTTEAAELARNAYLATHAVSSANDWTKRLRLLFRWAIRRNLIQSYAWKLKPLKAQQKVRVTLSPSHVKSWLEAVDTYGNAAASAGVRLMLGIGLREMEARTAQWQWFDWNRGTYTPGLTKGREAVPLHLPEWLIEFLRPSRSSAGFVVTGKRGKPLQPGFAGPAIRFANRAVGTIGVSPHSLRRTFASDLSEAGVPIHEIQHVLRHKNVSTTAGYLFHRRPMIESGLQRIAERNGLAAGKSGANHEVGSL